MSITLPPLYPRERAGVHCAGGWFWTSLQPRLLFRIMKHFWKIHFISLEQQKDGIRISRRKFCNGLQELTVKSVSRRNTFVGGQMYGT